MQSIYKEDFIQEIKKFGVKSFPKNIEVFSFPINSDFSLKSDLTEGEKAVQKILYEESLTLKSGQVSIYNCNERELIFVSSDFIVCQHLGTFEVMDIFCNTLYSFGGHFFSSDEYFYLKNRHFSFELDSKNKPIYSFSFSDHTVFPYKNISFTLKNNNTFGISSDALNLTSIKFEEDKILTTFKSSAYSSIVFDYDFNIKEVDLNKSIKQKLGLEKNKKYYDLKSYSELIEKIRESLKEEFDFYSLINDSKFKLKGSEAKFERDFLYIKELTAKRFQMTGLVEENHSKLMDFYNFFKKNLYLKTLDCSVPTSEDGRIELIKDTVLSKYKIEKKYLDNILLLLILNQKNNNNFMTTEILENYKDFSKGSSEIMDFNKKLISLKNLNKKNDKRKL